MARGQQKIQSQQKAQEKKKKMMKGKAADQKVAAAKKLIYQCTVCKTQMPDPKTYKQHFESKHPKSPMPDEIKDM
ncbi:zinc finger protein 706-like [Saccoglossus kowalevskii]